MKKMVKAESIKENGDDQDFSSWLKFNETFSNGKNNSISGQVTDVKRKATIVEYLLSP